LSRFLADALLEAVLAIPSTETATNFYLPDSDAVGGFRTTAAERRERLSAHLRRCADGDLIMVGEAPGWKGARQSGVPFTAAEMVGLDGVSSEATATIVHGMLEKLGIGDRTLLWNAFPLHPHDPGSPRTNRAPTAAELESGMNSLRLAAEGRRIICVGAKATSSVKAMLGIEVPGVLGASAADTVVAIRHPANGGATRFRDGLAAVSDLWGLA
jgi:hypothetical protein